MQGALRVVTLGCVFVQEGYQCPPVSRRLCDTLGVCHDNFGLDSRCAISEAHRIDLDIIYVHVCYGVVAGRKRLIGRLLDQVPSGIGSMPSTLRMMF